ncbi:MAG: response regulator, partial [Bacteroidales bacterium]
MEGPAMPIRGLINDLTRTLTGSLVHMDNFLLHLDNDSGEFDEAWLANHQLSRALEFFIELRSEYMMQQDYNNIKETKAYEPTAIEKLLHDFNNVLACIVGHYDSMQNDFADARLTPANMDYMFMKIQKSICLNEVYFNQEQPTSVNKLTSPTIIPRNMSNCKNNSINRILLVEDDEEINEIIRIYLSIHGYDVVTCLNGSEALAIFENHDENFDIYIIDVYLPDTEGPCLIKNIMLNKDNINILFISGYN